MTLALLAMPVHYLAPFRWKKPLFVAVSIAGLFLVAGPWASAIVLAVAAAFIGVCYLPIPWSARAAACAAMAIAIACARPALAAAGIPDHAWTIAASMFMFRMIIYLYELKHARAPESPRRHGLATSSCCPTTASSISRWSTTGRCSAGYFAADVHAIQRRGLAMMFRGTLHLLAYRLVYHQMLIPAGERARARRTWSAIVVCNYLLYLQVSGQFHMACGMLHLFGYQLPETHHRYLLATSFTDYWRRINIYWKDFMVRIFFNPVVFRLKRWPQPAALAAATAVVFLATWLLHAYQLYWLRGGWGFTIPDALFWGTLGVLVADQRPARRPPAPGAAGAGRCDRGADARPLATLAVRAAKVAGTFTTIALLWSLWSSPGLGAWLDMLGRGLRRTLVVPRGRDAARIDPPRAVWFLTG